MAELRPPIYWKYSNHALQEAMKAMDHRAKEEINRITHGETVDIVHEQAVRDYDHIDLLIGGAFKFLHNIGKNVSGSAIDMGSGTGVGASILSKYQQVKYIYALEFSEEFVLQIMPAVFEHFPTNSSKIQRVVGDFNNLEVEDSSIDIILDIDSFHHSEALDVTFNECWRVLKPGGVIISIDRAWPDSYSQNQLEEMLDRELNDNLKRKYNIPPNESFTRRDFGEHEYTVKQWERAYTQSGFDVNVFRQKHPPGLNSIFLRIPTYELTILTSSLGYKFGRRRHSIYGFYKTRTLFVCIKESK